MTAPSTGDPLPAGHAVEHVTVERVVDAVRPPRVPRRVWTWAGAAIVVLGVGGALLEHTLDAHGVPAFSVSASATTPLSASSGPTSAPAGSTAFSGSRVPGGSSEAQFMGVVHLDGGAAPPLLLTDQAGAPFSLAQLRGKVVVLAFLGSDCQTVCPVLAKEILLADSLLGPMSTRVAFVGVNTDPLATSTAAVSRRSVELGLGAMGNWYFLTGTLAELDHAWTRYGVTVDVSTTTHRVAHTDVVYLLDASGRERLRATPSVDESRTGRVSLPEASVRRFAAGLASYARALLAVPTSR